MKILILGSTGMLGKELVYVFKQDTKYEVIVWTHTDVDVTKTLELTEKIKDIKPLYIINAVAYNSVDLCEENEEEYKKAILLNKDVPESLAKISLELNITFVHFSTDYVFGKNKKIEGGFTESVIPIPNCKYAMSKYLGEESVKDIGNRFYIIRLSRLFGKQSGVSGKKSFFELMFNLSKTKRELQAVDDEISCFTYAPDLALATKELVESNSLYGIYHLVNEGTVSWYEGLIIFFQYTNKKIKINPVCGNTFMRKAKRPPFSVLNNTKRPHLRPYVEAIPSLVSTSDFSTS